MSLANPQRSAAMRLVIAQFLSVRLDNKLDKIKDDDGGPDSRTARLRQVFDSEAWIGDAARRATQIQVVTHSLKPTHPEARGTNLYIEPGELPQHGLLGSYVLGTDFERDVVCNAADLDVYKFLKLQFEGHSLLDLMLTEDIDLPAALSDDADQSAKWIQDFISIMKPRGTAASHTLAKQVYWLTGSDPAVDSDYHLLAPLFPTALIHRVCRIIEADRFSEASKTARKARKDNQFTDYILHDYPSLAVQKLGGTKPQNISQLNSERGGNNFLLASLPPQWNLTGLRPLLNADSVFKSFQRRPAVQNAVRLLVDFLESSPAANEKTRKRRDALVGELVGELLVYGSEMRTLPSGWSQSPICYLSSAEKQWLDPGALEIEGEPSGQLGSTSVIEQLSQAFGRWLNRELRDPLPMGDPEYLHWCTLAQNELEAEAREINHAV